MTDAPEVPPIRFTSLLPFVTIAVVAVLGFWPTSYTVNGDQISCGSVFGPPADLDGFDDYAESTSDEPLSGADRDFAELEARVTCSDARTGRGAWMLLAGVAGIALYMPTRARNVPF